MRIAILSPIHWRTPPRKYGPWELIASYISEGMVDRGHKVTLYATGDSKTRGRLRWVCPRPLFEDKSLETRVYQYLHSSLVFEEAQEFDIIHNHYDVFPLVFSRLVKTPVVTTMHGFSSEQVPIICKKYSNTYFVSISLADRAHAPDINWIANIYHGIPTEKYEFNESSENYFTFIGRISPDKGVHLALKVAKKMGLKFKFAGLIDEANREYFEKEIRLNLNKDRVYLGEISESEKIELLKNARGFLHLNTYPEGFGLSLIEAMACGTPVVAMNKGSIPEVVEDKKSGYVVENLEQVKDSISKIDEIKRKDCRLRVEGLFSLERMLNDYEKVYKKILEG